MPTLRVKIDRVIHRTKDFYVLATYVVQTEARLSDRKVKASGHISGLLQLVPGTSIQLNGDWTDHPKFGRQFSIHGWRPWAPDAMHAYKFLFECVDGFVDYALVRLITDHFGAKTFDALSESRSEVLSLATFDDDMAHTKGGISRSSMERALVAWDRLQTVYELTAMLQDHGLEANLIQAVVNRFGTDARSIISQNPYRLLEVRGVSVAQADRVAQNMGVPSDDPRRVQGALLASLRAASFDGHLLIRPAEIPRLFTSLAEEGKVRAFDTSPASVVQAIRSLKQVEAVKVDTKEGVYLPELYRYERSAASALAEFLTPVQIDVDPAGFLLDYQRVHQIDLSDAQRLAVEKILESRVLALTGLPGTGKTTALKAIVNLFDAAKIGYRLMAPTGIAAKRMAAVTGREAATIHRTFGFDGNEWLYGKHKKLTVDAVIIDEMSMVDQELFFRVLDALHPSTIMVFVGDDAQLPSVGPGNVLRELLACHDVPHVRLTRIFRQSDVGGIVQNSHKINSGEVPPLTDEDSEFKFVNIPDEEKIVDLIVEMATKLKARDANFQVLAPKYEGIVGIDRLNEALRDRLNPDKGQPEWKTKTLHLREGDRVMVIQNDYDLGIYNGDMGKVTEFTKDDVVVRIHGLGPNDLDVVVEIPKGEAVQKLRLAYAISVHRCLHPDTLVETEGGLTRISEAPDSGWVSTPEGRQRYTRKVFNPIGEMLELETKDGYRLRVTPEHGVDVWDPTIGYVRKEASEILCGDFVRLRLGAEFPKQAPPQLPPNPQIDVRAEQHTVPTMLTEDVAEFFGYMVADGTIYDRGFRYGKGHPECTARVEALVSLLFGCTPKRWFDLGCYYAQVNSTQLSSWLVSIGGMCPRGKYIPPVVLKAAPSVQAAFLRGLFEDGSVHLRRDGTLDHVELFTSFPDLARDVKTLLLRLGIVSGLLKRRTGTTIYIYGAFAKVYADRVGFITPYKRERLAAPCGNATRYLVPVLKREIREICDANGGPHRFMTNSDENVYNRGYTSRHGLEDFLRRATVKSPAWEALHSRLTFHHSRVRSVTSLQAPSFCFEVPEGHQFVQDGFCGWNSQGSEWDTVILPITRTQGRMLQRNLFYTAVTRAKKRVWLLGHKDAVGRAIANDRVVQRNTALAKAISGAVQAFRAPGVEEASDAGKAEKPTVRPDGGAEGPAGETAIRDPA